MEVLVQLNVPSASGESVGIVKNETEPEMICASTNFVRCKFQLRRTFHKPRYQYSRSSLRARSELKSVAPTTAASTKLFPVNTDAALESEKPRSLGTMNDDAAKAASIWP